ncbi:MAG: tetratricopeptide repeat protein [Pleurocapsa sp.]
MYSIEIINYLAQNTLIGLLLTFTVFILSSDFTVEAAAQNNMKHIERKDIQRHGYQSALTNTTTAVANINKFGNDNKILVSQSQHCLANLEQEQYLGALLDCSKAVEYEPENLTAHFNLGLAYYHLEEYKNAIAQYQIVVQQNSHNYKAFYNQGLAYAAFGKYEAAINNYNIALNSSNTITAQEKSLINNDLGAAYIMLADCSQAIAFLDRANELDPNSEAVYFSRGCAHHRQGSYQMGIKDFN